MPQNFDVIANENTRYKRNELEWHLRGWSYTVITSIDQTLSMTLLQNELLNEFLEVFIEDFQWMWRRMKDAFMDHPFLRKLSPSLFLTCLDQWHSQLIRQFTNSWPNHRTWTYSSLLPNFIDLRTHLQRLRHVNRRRSSLRAPCPVPPRLGLAFVLIFETSIAMKIFGWNDLPI